MALGWDDAIMGGASLVSGLLGNSSAKKAAKQQADAIREGNEILKTNLARTREDAKG